MGKQTRLLQAEAQAKAHQVQARLGAHEVRRRAQPAPLPLETLLLPHRAAWLRDPATFVLKLKSRDRAKQELALVRHCLVRYRVPAVLDRAWSANAPVRSLRGGTVEDPVRLTLDFKAWYICVAQGGSLYKAHTKALGLTKADTHAFLGAPADLSLDRALIYALARGAGSSEGQARRVASSKLGDQRPTAAIQEMARFLAQPMFQALPLPQMDDLLDYWLAQRQAQTPVRLFGAGHTLASLAKRVQDWHWSLRRIRAMGQASWDGVGLPDEAFEGQFQEQPARWHLAQITTAKALVAEGNAMHHCVASYKSACVQGRLSIWSLTLETPMGERKRRLTLELRDNGDIAQMRGYANRLARPEERHIVAQWAHQHQLRVLG